MNKISNYYPNQIRQYRREYGLLQKEVSYLLGHKSSSHISYYERRKKLPSLATALKLEIILRKPISYLFPDLYQTLRQEIRNKEEVFLNKER